ncbi:MAG: metalloprotease, partial [Flavobacteriaceae bacterium]
EGGFKSIIPNSNANQWMLSANLTFGLWRWIEVYLDGALLKNKGEGVAQYYDTGLRFNLLPDYLELFFPVASTSEVALTSPYYTSKIRFVLSIRGNQLKALFSRSWF